MQTFTPGPYQVEQRSEFCFAVLGTNPDAGKSGVVYSGAQITVCTTDGREDAERVAHCLNEVARQEHAFPAPVAV